MSDAIYFRFLDLPKELRLRVYGMLPRRVVRQVFEFESRLNFPRTIFCVFLQKTTTDTTILATCRKVDDEAREIVRVQSCAVENEPIQLEIDGVGNNGIIDIITCISFSEGTADALVALQDTLGLTRHARPGTYNSGQPRREVHLAVKRTIEDDLAVLLEGDGVRLRATNSFLRLHGRNNLDYFLRYISCQDETKDPERTMSQVEWLQNWSSEETRVITVGDDIKRYEYKEDWGGI